MKTEDILAIWDEDSKFHPNISRETLKGPFLHRKYYEIYMNEKLRLRKMETDFARLKTEKYEFYTQGPDENTPKDWDLRGGKKLKSEVAMWLDSDPHLIDATLKIALQFEKVEMLKSIIDIIKWRRNDIKNHIEALKFENGG